MILLFSFFLSSSENEPRIGEGSSQSPLTGRSTPQGTFRDKKAALSFTAGSHESTLTEKKKNTPPPTPLSTVFSSSCHGDVTFTKLNLIPLEVIRSLSTRCGKLQHSR